VEDRHSRKDEWTFRLSMRCLYCDQPLSFFKSLGGSSFCSPEHQKLYEDVQSIAAFERLLEFARQDSKPTAGPSDGTAPSTAEPVGQQAKPASLPTWRRWSK